MGIYVAPAGFLRVEAAMKKLEYAFFSGFVQAGVVLTLEKCAGVLSGARGSPALRACVRNLGRRGFRELSQGGHTSR